MIMMNSADQPKLGAIAYNGTSGASFSLQMILLVLCTLAFGRAQTVTVMAGLSGQGCSAKPSGSVTQGRDGKLYGTTLGASGSAGCFFRLAAGGIMFPFTFDSTNGNQPVGGPTLATDGNYYGVTQYGGAPNNGVLYRVTSSGNYSVL